MSGNATLTDNELLERVIDDEFEDRVSVAEREAFSEMLDRGYPLSKKQRRWLYGVADRLGVQTAPAENTFSEMSERQREEHVAAVRTALPWERPGYVKALKPPGR